MEFQSYNAELGIANLMFQSLFNNIRIERTDAKNQKSQLKVQCTFGQRSRILKNLQNPERRGNLKVPMIILTRNGYSRNGERLNNLHNEVKYELTPSHRIYELMAPIPIDINYSVFIVAKYPQDIDKIASNFMVMFNSDLFVSFEHPKYEGIKINSQIIMDDSVNEEHPEDLDGSADDLITATFGFTFKTYLFAGTSQAKLIHPQIISTYTSSFTSSIVVELGPNEIDQFQKQNPTASISVLSSVDLTTDISTYVNDMSSQIYDNVPIINQLMFDFYNVPFKENIPDFIQSVDNGLIIEHHDGVWEGEISNNYYVPVDNYCTLAPLVDKIYWGIDAKLTDKFPNNVTVLGH